MRPALLPILLLPFLACETTREQADTGVSRSKQVHPRSVRRKEQRLKAHKSLPRDRLTETLTHHYADQLPTFTADLVRHPTFLDPASPDAEPAARQAFFTTLKSQADQLGLPFSLVTPLAAEMEIPSEPPGADRVVALFAHGDVVAPGDAWTQDPFGGALKEGRLYGRGAMDNKGPIVAAMAALAAFRDVGNPRPFVTRLVVGMAQESSGDCITGYLHERPAPDFSVVMDGAFPVSVGEKGIASIKVAQRRHEATPASGTCLVQELDGGTSGSAVPSAASAVLTCAGNIQDVAQALSNAANVKVGLRGNQLRVTSHGRSQDGFHAIGVVLLALDAFGHLDDEAPGTQLVRFLAASAATDETGKTLGVEGQRAGFTANTVNLGKLRTENGLFVASLTVRFVPGPSVDDVVDTVRNAAATFATRSSRPMRLFVDGSGLPASEVAPDRPEVLALLRAYTAVMERPAKTVTSSAPTYARALPNAVVFGPELPGQPERRHQPDEFITSEELFTLARVYAQALTELAGPDTPQTVTKPR